MNAQMSIRIFIYTNHSKPSPYILTISFKLNNKAKYDKTFITNESYRKEQYKKDNISI
jgi:hypothetical protein